LISEDAVITGDCTIGVKTVIFPQVQIRASAEGRVVIGERNILEEKCEVQDSSLEHANVLSVGCSVNRCSIGSFNTIGLACRLEGCTLGNLCIVAAGVCMKDVTLGDNSSVFLSPSGQGWSAVVLPSESLKLQHETNAAYHTAVSEPISPQFAGRHLKLRAQGKVES